MATRLVAAFAALLISIPAPAPAQAFGAGTRGGIALPPGAAPYGLTLGEWAAEWWKWVLTAPVQVNPVLDTTGAHCDVGQRGQVWFLAGSFGSDPVVRRCTVPVGRSLFFPVMNMAWIGFPTDPPMTVDEMLAIVAPVEQATGLAVLVDGVPVPDLSRYLVTSPVFSAVAPADNIADLPAGSLFSPCLSEGFYVMLSPLAPGRHTVAIRARLDAIDLTQDVTYNLDIVAGR